MMLETGRENLYDVEDSSGLYEPSRKWGSKMVSSSAGLGSESDSAGKAW